MSKIEELVRQHCPDGVKYRAIKAVVTIKTPPKKIKKSEFERGGAYPIIDQSQDFIAGFTDDEAALLPEGQYVLFGDHTLAVKYFDGRFAQGADGLKILEPDATHVISRYLYHCMLSYLIPSQGYSRHWTKMAQVEIPIPPIEVQQEIVRILDKLSSYEDELVAKLQEELEAREKQFEAYREILLAFSEMTDRKKLSDICLKTNNIKWVNIPGQTFEYIDLSSVDKETGRIIETVTIDESTAPSRAQQIVFANDILFATTRPTQMRVCQVPDDYDGQICSTGYCVIRPNAEIVAVGFLKHILKLAEFKKYLEDNQTMGNYPAISNKKLLDFDIPVPPIATQREIVAKLDVYAEAHEALIANLREEVRLRHMQYEHYRDALLSFEKKGA